MSHRLHHRTYDPTVEKVVPRDAVVLAEWERELLTATAPDQETKVVPVNSIVLNPDSGVVWEFLKQNDDALTAPTVRGFRLAQEIRKQLPAPRIPEPGWGSVVMAGVAQHEVRLRWVRIARDSHRPAWTCEDSNEYDRHWAELIDPEVQP